VSTVSRGPGWKIHMLATMYILRGLSLLCGGPDGEAGLVLLIVKDSNAVSKLLNPTPRVANPAPKAM
jgi:hypothetical protein